MPFYLWSTGKDCRLFILSPVSGKEEEAARGEKTPGRIQTTFLKSVVCGWISLASESLAINHAVSWDLLQS